MFTRKPETETEIQIRLMSRNRGIYALGKLIRSKNASRKTKLRIHKTVFRSIVTYASEVWTLNIAQRNKIRALERKVLLKIYRGKSVNEMWTRRTNEEVRELYGEPDTITVINSQRLPWLVM